MKNFLRALPALLPALTAHLSALLFCAPTAFAGATPAVANLPEDVQRVVFLGDSITNSGFMSPASRLIFSRATPNARLSSSTSASPAKPRQASPKRATPAVPFRGPIYMSDWRGFSRKPNPISSSLVTV